MPNISGTYTIVVKGNKIVSVVKDQEPMNETDVRVPKPNFEDNPPPGHDLVHGCIGLGMAYEIEGRQTCRWLFDSWW